MAEEQQSTQQEQPSAAQSTAGAQQGQATERVGFGPRLGAYVLDIVIASVIGGIIGMVAGASLVSIFMPSMAPGSASVQGLTAEQAEAAQALAQSGAGILGGMIGTIAGILLFQFVIFLIEAFAGTTPGKMIIGLKNANQDGTSGSIGTYLTRAAIKYIHLILSILAGLIGVSFLGTLGSILGLVVFIGCFFVLGERRQAFHDMLAKSAVFRKNEIKPA